MKFKYIVGDYPTTMQGYLNKYNEVAFKEVFDGYKNRFNLTKSFDYKEDKNDKFYLNFSAYVILNESSQIVDFAFEEFHDFVWILQIINIDGLEFDLDEKVIEQIKSDLDDYSDRIQLVK